VGVLGGPCGAAAVRVDAGQRPPCDQPRAARVRLSAPWPCTLFPTTTTTTMMHTARSALAAAPAAAKPALALHIDHLAATEAVHNNLIGGAAVACIAARQIPRHLAGVRVGHVDVALVLAARRPKLARKDCACVGARSAAYSRARARCGGRHIQTSLPVRAAAGSTPRISLCPPSHAGSVS
jgi:hypothetical protein